MDHSSSSIWVLRDDSPKDVAKAMIQQGNQKQPFYLFNMDDVYRRVQHFRDMMPRIQIFYAMKSNDTSMMVKLAIALGLGFDCASPGEIYKLQILNVPCLSIIYAAAVKTEEQMVYARTSGIKHTTFDSSHELKKLKDFWPDARLLIRIRVDSVSVYRLGEKFGCDFETEAVDLLDEAANLGLQVVGVAFHVGSVCTSIESYEVGLRQARELFDHEARAGRKMRLLDIGGGFPGDRTDAIDQVSKLINKMLDELFPDPDVQVVAEPGRYICDSAFTLYCSISNVRRVKRNDGVINMVYLNDGMFGTLSFTEKWHKIKMFQANESSETNTVEETILWGPSCDSFDQVMKEFDIRLPQCKPLDWLIFEKRGAYTICHASCFSSLPLPLIRSVISINLWERIKHRSIFSASDFLMDPDISRPLPLCLPPPAPKNKALKHTYIPTLNL